LLKLKLSLNRESCEDEKPIDMKQRYGTRFEYVLALFREEFSARKTD
jgi:hypothetical protein